MPLLSQFLLTSICGILTRLRRAIPRSTSLWLISCPSPWNDFTASSDVFIALDNLGKAKPSQFVLLCLAISRLMPVQRKRRVFVVINGVLNALVTSAVPTHVIFVRVVATVRSDTWTGAWKEPWGLSPYERALTSAMFQPWWPARGTFEEFPVRPRAKDAKDACCEEATRGKRICKTRSSAR